MRSGLSNTLVSFGAVFLSFGLVFVVLTLLGSHFGTPHPTGGILGAGFLVGGVVLWGAGVFLNRSA